MAFRKRSVPHVALLAEYLRLRVDADVDIDSHRSFLRHPIPVQASNANVNLHNSHLLYMAGGSRCLFTVRSLCHHHHLREPHLLRGELGKQIISTGKPIFYYEFLVNTRACFNLLSSIQSDNSWGTLSSLFE